MGGSEGLGALASIIIGAVIGYAIRPDLLDVNTPLSRLGTDARTSPYFAGSMFLAAYSLWRWRMYLRQTVRNTKPLIPLISLTILGLYLIALMPVTWRPWPYKLHHFGVFLTGVSMAATVVVDGLLSKTRKSPHAVSWGFIKLIAVLLIVFGGIVSFLSLDTVGKLP